MKFGHMIINAFKKLVKLESFGNSNREMRFEKLTFCFGKKARSHSDGYDVLGGFEEWPLFNSIQIFFQMLNYPP